MYVRTCVIHYYANGEMTQRVWAGRVPSVVTWRNHRGITRIKMKRHFGGLRAGMSVAGWYGGGCGVH